MFFTFILNCFSLHDYVTTLRRGICLTCHCCAKTVNMRIVTELLFKVAFFRIWYFASFSWTTVCVVLLFHEEEKGILLLRVCSSAWLLVRSNNFFGLFRSNSLLLSALCFIIQFGEGCCVVNLCMVLMSYRGSPLAIRVVPLGHE